MKIRSLSLSTFRRGMTWSAFDLMLLPFKLIKISTRVGCLLFGPFFIWPGGRALCPRKKERCSRYVSLLPLNSNFRVLGLTSSRKLKSSMCAARRCWPPCPLVWKTSKANLAHVIHSNVNSLLILGWYFEACVQKNFQISGSKLELLLSFGCISTEILYIPALMASKQERKFGQP